MAILSDRWIREAAQTQRMIEPFVAGGMTSVTNRESAYVGPAGAENVQIR